ncbi:ribonuclease Y [Sanguibacter suaedae]|uniref:Ribonuclease Y n=1 Tax=Sanguibacter suaedae TaxID=2795737 RepID=A0A934I4M1_9MICO|nr:ribonuclease Y [Sanguibacter suaedae]MBI9115504.1 ribonuclease Y [Sanguibacter suaedae]
MTAGEFLILLGLLGASLVALLLVQVARREADAVRAQAAQDVAEQRADLRRRTDELRDAERAVADERRRAEALMVRAESAAAELATTTEAQRAETSALRDEALAELERVAGLTTDEAATRLTERLRTEAEKAAASSVRRAEAAARAKADARARDIVTTAVQRLAVPTSSAVAVDVLPLPSEDMRGRIIGKEGRNIRTFEAVTGVNVLLEDDSTSVQLSSFDPERREVAAVTLKALMDDGRIHPQRIESAYAEAVAGAQERAVDAGRSAAHEAGVGDLADDLVAAMGALRLRASFSQDVLRHSIEAALVAAAMAAEVGADVETARRAAFLHDIGKGLSGSRAGTHAAIGAALVRRAGEPPVVVNAVAAHHGEVPAESVEAVLVQAADACSAARPGARRDDADRFAERMLQLEQLVASHPGVRRALAMSAGHEVRVVVEPGEVSDAELPGLATAIAAHVETDLSYPGEISITVVRELRATATAG